MKNSKIKILVVDDSQVILKLLKEYFKTYDVEIVTSINGLDGIKKSMKLKPDIILLDLLMPNFDGMKMLQVIKLMDELRDVPVIVISGNTDKTNVLTAIESGAEQVLAKPLKKNVLINAVENSLGYSLPRGLNSADDTLNYSDDELKTQLKKLFVDNYNSEKAELKEALSKKETDRLKRFAHNARSVGSSIDYPQLTKINTEIEQLLTKDTIDWQIVRIKFSQVFSIIKDLENSLAVWEN